jgi:hypothetical protein
MKKLTILFLIFLLTATLNLGAGVIVNTGTFTALNGYLYIGDPTSDGSWRIRPGSYNLQYEKRVSGSWAVKDRDYEYYQEISRTDAYDHGCGEYACHSGYYAYINTSFTEATTNATKLRIRYDWQSSNCSGYDYYTHHTTVQYNGSTIEDVPTTQTSWVSRDNTYTVNTNSGSNTIFLGDLDGPEDCHAWRNAYIDLYTPDS